MPKPYRSIVDWDGLSPFMWLFGFAGTTKSNMTEKLYRIFQPGHFASFNLVPGETVLTKGLLGYALLTSVNAGNTSILIPTFVALGHTWEAASPINLKFAVQRRGDGLVFVNAGVGVTVEMGNLAPETLEDNPVVTFITIGVDKWKAI